VSGRYTGRSGNFEVELRVDVDGSQPCSEISADYFRTSDHEYVCSMRVHTPRVTTERDRVRITGTGTFSTDDARARVIAVTIPHPPLGRHPVSATLHHAGRSGPGSTYRCRFVANSFRVVELEEACQVGVQQFTSYDTGLLASAGAPRTLSAATAFGEAGIEVRPTGPPSVVDTSGAGPNATWSDAELHAAMEQHFTRLSDHPRWAIWLLHAMAHDDPDLAGIMFDQRDLQRQGCAVFYGHAHHSDPASVRGHLHGCVHELGHGFNLMHCWQKSRAEPPLPSRPDAASWMNYPHLYPGGPDRFWRDFDFRFDDLELSHLRHGFRNSVIMGGAAFGADAALRRGGDWEQEAQNRTLRLGLTAPRAFAPSMPVTVGLELSSTSARGSVVPPVLGPRPATVDIGITKPNGKRVVFEPLIQHCRGDETVTLRAADNPLRDEAFIHYGKQGFTFDRPGIYEVRARFTAADGSVVLSNSVSIRIGAPSSPADRDVARLVEGNDEVGTLMSLMGSDAPALDRGNDVLREVVARHPSHPIAIVARLVRATNAARPFKAVAAGGDVRVRDPLLREARALVDGIVDIPRVHAAARTATSTLSERRMIMQALPQPSRAGVAAAVGGLIRSRRSEVAQAVPLLTGPNASSFAAFFGSVNELATLPADGDPQRETPGSWPDVLQGDNLSDKPPGST
jgi:hypothetical protein